MIHTNENIRLWMERSEPDYFILFLKAWIPFNAWYVAEYTELKRKDAAIIKKLIEDDSSKPKLVFKNYIENSSDHESVKFKSYLSDLHDSLQRAPILHNNKRLSFESIALTENPVRHDNATDKHDNVYKVERTISFFQAYVEAIGGKVLLDFKYPAYCIETLTKDTDFIRLDKQIQRIVLSLFERINPKKDVSIISDSDNPSEYLKCTGVKEYKLVNDSELVAKACIKTLYALRCMLFHGEVAPTITNKGIYENGFHLLSLLINKFK